MSQLSVKAIACQYDNNRVVEGFGFNLNTGDICCLLGPSGCGKTTVLRSIAGFIGIAEGEISLAGKTISAPGFTLAPEKRRIGMVFQDYALFPHLSVAENIRFGLGHLSESEQNQRISEMLDLVKLTEYSKRFAHELSGGQQQRIALARALAPKPALLLLDEPFSSLDVELRRSLALEIRDILKACNTTAIMVTHDQQEAFAMADKIGVVNNGCIQQWDTPFNLYHEPATRFVANFIGQGVFLSGFAVNEKTVSTEIGDISGDRCYNWPEKAPVEVLLRPDDIVYCEDSSNRAQVVDKVFAGTSTLYHLKLATGSVVEAAFPSHRDCAIGEHVGICIDADHLIAFPSENS